MNNYYNQTWHIDKNFMCFNYKYLDNITTLVVNKINNKYREKNHCYQDPVT